MNYIISEDGKSIRCLWCGRTSYNLNDVKNLYCGWCDLFLDDMPEGPAHSPRSMLFWKLAKERKAVD